MKKVLLIGDSIRINYQDKVRELLDGKAEILSPNENCQFAARTLFCLQTWAPDNDYDVIQWNNGQWDTCYMLDGKIHTPLPVYLELEKRIADILMRKAKRAVFATTTPVWPDQFECATQNGRKDEDIQAYNQAVSEVLRGMGVEITDLHTALAPDVKRYISEDKVHLSSEGIDRCARLVADRLMA